MSNLLPQPSSTSSSSATGNPRNKTALKPGHSLMDWVRLRGSGVDLAGTKGVVTPVSLAELRKHNKRSDAWMAIRGKVYNVTRYMDFHPGGVEELMKGVGMDATQMFEDVHAWVNYDQMLSKCYIGPLCGGGGGGGSASKIVSSTSSSQLNTGSSLAANFRLPFSISANNFITNSLAPPSNSSNTGTGDVKRAVPVAQEVPQIIPRFDWIQKTSELIFVFYTRAFCNPGLVIESIEGSADGTTSVEVRINVDGGSASFLAKFSITEPVRWPCSVKSSLETGKVELNFVKIQPKLWSSYGTMEMTKASDDLEQQLRGDYEYRVVQCERLNHDSFEVTLKPKRNILMHLPVGHHVSIGYDTPGVEEEMVRRSYTPVPRTYLTESRKIDQELESEFLSFLVKSYETGRVSKYLCQSGTRVSGAKEEVETVVRVSPPRGNFTMGKLKGHTRIAFLAAGSGITPFLGIVEQLIGKDSKPNQQIEQLSLMYFNKTEADIWCRSTLDGLASGDHRVSIKYVLTDADSSWDGERGRITRDQIVALTEPQSKDHVSFIGVCGPPAFNRQVVEYLTATDFPANAQHIFQG